MFHRRRPSHHFDDIWAGWTDEEAARLIDEAVRPEYERRLGEGADANELAAELNEKLAGLDDEMSAALSEAISEGGRQLHLTLLRRSPGMLRWRRKLRHGMAKRLDGVWGDVFDLLEIVLHDCWEIGASVRHTQPSGGEDYRFEALTFLHARACAVAGEIDALLRAGFSSGARARWRTLHELAVTSSVIGGGDQALAERYLLHTVVDEYKDALAEEETQQRTGHTVDRDDIDQLKTAYDSLLERFGKSFRHDWAWASPATRTERPSFRDLEKLAELDHLRTWYRSASHLTHAGSRGTADIVTPVRGGNILLTGPTNAGLSGPAHSTAISLMQVTVTVVVRSRPDVAPHPVALAGLKALQAQVDDVGAAGESAEALVDCYRAEEIELGSPAPWRAVVTIRRRRAMERVSRKSIRWLRRRSKRRSARWQVRT